MSAGTPSPLLRFATFEVNIGTGELRRYGHRIKLQEKPFQILEALLERPGALVSREELHQRLWSGDTFVDFDHNLNNAVDKLRKALNDSAEQPKFIETLPRRGYRFIGAVEPLEEPPGQPTIATNDQFKEVRQDGLVSQEESLRTRDRPALLEIDVPAALHSTFWRSYSGQNYAVWASALVLLMITISTVAVLLRKVTGSAKMAQPSFARLLVLPVQNLTGVTEQEYLANGLTEELITRLGKIAPQSLGVIAPTTTMRLKNSPKSPEEIGSELNVEYVLASNLRHLEKRVRISVQLVRVGDRAQMWAADYEREDQNLLGIPNKIAVSIAPLLQLPSKAVIASVIDEGTKDNEAYGDYLRGRYFWNKRLKEEVSIARDYFSKAVARDPNYAKAYSGLGDSYIVLAGSHIPASVAFGKAQEPHNSLAYVMYAENWDWAGAEREYKHALELDPQYAVAHHWYFIYLTSMKRFPEAISEAEKALEFDPLSQSINYNAAMTYILAGQDERGLRQLQKAIELDPNNPVPYGYLGLLYEREHKYDQAAQQFQKAEGFETEKSTYLFDVAGAYAREGRVSEARRLAEKLTAHSKTHYTNPYWFAAMYTGFGDQNKVIHWLELAVHQRSCTALEINTDSRLDFLRSDPRFQKLTSEMRLAVQ
jgi:TolB-like protein/DNA-binding winged helix-turn-helix (wHTH) protein/Flp pilus assembly protein TadD